MFIYIDNLHPNWVSWCFVCAKCVRVCLGVRQRKRMYKKRNRVSRVSRVSQASHCRRRYRRSVADLTYTVPIWAFCVRFCHISSMSWKVRTNAQCKPLMAQPRIDLLKYLLLQVNLLSQRCRNSLFRSKADEHKHTCLLHACTQ